MVYPFQNNEPVALPTKELHDLGKELKVGDLVFIGVSFFVFRKVAEATRSWTNHVGIVIDTSGPEPLIAEGKIPFSATCTWPRFVSRSQAGRVALARLGKPVDTAQRMKLIQAVRRRMGVLYDTGFNLHSRRQFCSRFAHEVLKEALGTKVGRIETFADLLKNNPLADLKFWRIWYFGRIPWSRETVTPASMLQDEQLTVYFDGHAYQDR